MVLTLSSHHSEKSLNANFYKAWEDQRVKLSLNSLSIQLQEKHWMEQTKKTSTVELSGLNSQDKPLVDINHKEQEQVPEKLTPYLLEILVGTQNNGLLKNSSRDAELLLE